MTPTDFELRGDEPFQPGLHLLLARQDDHSAWILTELNMHRPARVITHTRFGAYSHYADIESRMVHLASTGAPHLLSTMSIAAIDGMGFEHTIDDVRERLLFASPEGDIMKLTVDAAERFLVAYKTGVQKVSEILRSEGFW